MKRKYLKLKTIILLLISFLTCLFQISSSLENTGSINGTIINSINVNKEYFGSKHINSSYTFSANSVVWNEYFFNKVNSSKKPYINFFNGSTWDKRVANHSYTSSAEGIGASRNYKIIKDGWYGANINIATGLEGWGYASGFGNWNWIKKHYLNSKLSPNGLNYDDGSFAKMRISRIDNVNYSAFQNLIIKFGLDNEEEIYDYDEYGNEYKRTIYKQFGTSDNQGVDISSSAFSMASYELKNEIKKLNQNGKKYINGYLTNVEIDLNFYLDNDNYNGKTLDSNFQSRLTQFRININFNFNYYYQAAAPEKVSFNKKLNFIKTNFENSILNNNNLSINTDTGDSLGLKTPKISSSDTTNQQFLETKLKSWWNSLSDKRDLTLKYKDLKNNHLNVYLEFIEPETNRKNIFYLGKNINLVYLKTSKYLEKDLSKRIVITPHKFLDLRNSNNPKLVDDIPELIVENNKPISESYGGKWRYNVPVKVDFLTTIKEDEILLINNKKIDVIDQKFSIDLYDERFKTNGKNTYLIKLQKFDKNNVNQENSRIIKTWTKEIIINSLVSKLNINWYAWNPSENIEQKKLIEPYLKDENNKEILDSEGNKVKNPQFDPLIDPSTGTKKQLVWINYGSINSPLPYQTRFLQNPLNQNGELISDFNNFQKGFIAEAIVVSKGVNMKISNSENYIKRFKISNNMTNFTLENDFLTSPITNNGNQVYLSQNENNYFSSSGNWLFSFQTPRGMSGYKIVYINNKNFSNQLYTSIFVNENINPFWNTYHGLNLKKFLIKKFNFNFDYISKISYQEILEYWKMYVNDVLKNQTINSGYKILIQPKVNYEKIRAYTKNIKRKDFNYQNLTTEMVFEKFEHQEKINFEITTSENNLNLLSIKFKLNPSIMNEEYEISPNCEEFWVSWKDDWIEYSKNSKNKKEIIPIVNKDLILLFSSNHSFNTFYNLPLKREWLNFQDNDKVDYKIIPGNDIFWIIFSVSKVFQEKYFINFQNSHVKVNVNFHKKDNSKIELKDLLKFNTIELNNLQTQEEIELKIKNILNNHLSNFQYGMDYEVENFSQKILEIQKNNTENIKNNHLFSFIKVHALIENTKNLIGQKIIKVFNFSIPKEIARKIIEEDVNDVLIKEEDTILDLESDEILKENTNSILNIDKEKFAKEKLELLKNALDLSTINIQNIILENIKNVNELKQKVLNNIIFQLKEQNIDYDNNLYIQNFDNKIFALWIFENNEKIQTFKILSKNLNFKNFKEFKVFIKQHQFNNKIDLENFKISELYLSETNPEIIINKIKKHILEQMSEYNLLEARDFWISSYWEIKNLKKLISKPNEFNSLEIILSAKTKHSKLIGKTGFLVFNKFTKLSLKDKQKWKQYERDKQKLKKSNENYLWIIPIVLVNFPILIFIIKKFFLNQIKFRKIK